MTGLSCPQCDSPDVTFYDGMLGYEAIRCNVCNQETDANRSENHCLRTDRPLNMSAPLPDLCDHSEYRIHANGRYVESAGSLGANVRDILESWQRSHHGKRVEVWVEPCRVLSCDGRPQ